MKPARMLRVWSPDELARMDELLAGGASITDVAGELGRSENAVKIKRRRHSPDLRDREVNYGFGQGRPGRTRFWTKERVVAGLQAFGKAHRGPLPTSDHTYNAMKKGHLEWPTSDRVLEYFGTMADAWEAAGFARGRVSRQWVPWTQEDDDYLLEHAGEQTLKRIAAHLGRSWQACKRRVYDLGVGRARDVSGHMSALQVAAEYRCPAKRVTELIVSGQLKATKVVGGHYWRIDPLDAERVRHLLTAPKKTHKAGPVDVGDYRKRYGYRRVTDANGRMVEVAVAQQAAEADARKAERRRITVARRVAVQRLEAAGAVIDLGVAS